MEKLPAESAPPPSPKTTSLCLPEGFCGLLSNIWVIKDLAESKKQVASYKNSWAQGWSAKASIRPWQGLIKAVLRPS